MSLSPQAVQQIIRDEVIPLESRTMSSEAVREVLRYGAPVGSSILRFEHLERGMEYARSLISASEQKGESFCSGTVILADTLGRGKGRFQREWHAPRGGVWMTLALVNTLLPESTHFCPLAVGVACCEALRQCKLDARVRWVNDVLVDNRKIAGVLTETMRGPGHGEEYLLIGIGVNVNNDSFPDELAPVAIAMKDILGRETDIDFLAARLLARLRWNIGLLHYEEAIRLDKGADPGSESIYGDNGKPGHMLLNKWQELSDSIGRRVSFGYDIQQQPMYEAEVAGISPFGGLLLKRHDDGITVEERAGEIVYL